MPESDAPQRGQHQPALTLSFTPAALREHFRHAGETVDVDDEQLLAAAHELVPQDALLYRAYADTARRVLAAARELAKPS